MKLQLNILEKFFTIHRFPANHKIPNQVYESPFYSISKTDEELSIVCNSTTQVNSDNSNVGWFCIKIEGPLDFSLTGILAKFQQFLLKLK